MIPMPLPSRTRFRLIARAATLVTLTLSLLCGSPLPHVGKAIAQDSTIDLSASAVTRSLRLGLQKSAVLKLPAIVKDVIVGDPSKVDVVLKNRSTAYLFARAAGQTNVFFLDAAGRQILQLNLEVTLDASSLKSLLDRSLPGSAIVVDSTGSNVILKGTIADAEQGKMAQDLAQRFIATYGGSDTSVVNLLRIAQGNQVMLKVRVVELKRTLLKQLGINLDGQISAGPFNFKWVNSTYPVSTPRILDGVANIPGGPVDITATIRALEGNGLATVLAEPTLTAVSGAPASFHAGGQYPYSVCDAPQVDNQYYNCSIQFQKYGITLDFTPTVLSEGRIALNIFTEVSDLADNPYNSTQPVIDFRNANTSIELPSGGSMMLAGLIKNVSLQKLNNTPGLRSLPILGALFSSQQFQRNQSELVVIVTPYVVDSMKPEQTATPIDRYNSPTDLQMLFLGRLNKIYGPPGSNADTASGTYHGDIGHIIE